MCASQKERSEISTSGRVDRRARLCRSAHCGFVTMHVYANIGEEFSAHSNRQVDFPHSPWLRHQM